MFSIVLNFEHTNYCPLVLLCVFLQVVLVGGVSNTPRLRETVASFFEQPSIADDMPFPPEESVTRGEWRGC